MKRPSDRRCAAAPIETDYCESLEFQRIGEIHHVLSNCSLLRHSRTGCISEACWAIAAQIRYKNTVAGLGERRRHIIESVNVIRKTVEQDDWITGGIPALDVPYVQHRRIDRLFCSDASVLSPGKL